MDLQRELDRLLADTRRDFAALDRLASEGQWWWATVVARRILLARQIVDRDAVPDDFRRLIADDDYVELLRMAEAAATRLREGLANGIRSLPTDPNLLADRP